MIWDGYLILFDTGSDTHPVCQGKISETIRSIYAERIENAQKEPSGTRKLDMEQGKAEIVSKVTGRILDNKARMFYIKNEY